jgi:hypothetical protein
MARSDWIQPLADAACGRAFYPDRRTAEAHRIALEFWDQATGRGDSRRLVACHCKRCGGFHLARRKLRKPSRPLTAEGSLAAALPEPDDRVAGITLGLERRGREARP